MENICEENPWNVKLQSLDGRISENNCKVLIKRGFISRFGFLKNMPHFFNKFDNLVLCNICHILICKKSSFNHAKLHDKQNESAGLVYKKPSCNGIENILPKYDAKLVNVRKQTIKSHVKLQNKTKEKRRKVSEDKIVNTLINNKVSVEDDLGLNTNFIPKSTLNAANPLRIKIQLQPKPENEPRNGNIFDNINNFCKNITNNNLPRNLLNEETELNSLDLTNEQTMRMKQHNHATTNRVFKIQKFLPSPQQRSNSMKSMSTSTRPYGTAIISHSMPGYLGHPNQTSSGPCQMRRESPQLSQQPQVFQTLRQGTFPIKSSQKKYVQVKSLHDTMMPVSSTQSLNSSTINQDLTQRSFQKILIDNGMFSEEDIKRAQRSNFDRTSSVPEMGQTSKIRRTANVPVRYFHSNPNNSRPQFVNNYPMRPSSANQRSSGIIMPKSDQYNLSHPPRPSTIKNHNNQRYQNIEISDDEFILDHHTVQAGHQSTKVNNRVSQYGMSNLELPQSSNLSKNIINQTMTAQCPVDFNTDVHYLPPPEETITSLSWEQ